MKIAITGATSFIGRNIINLVIEKKWECIAIVKNEIYAKKLWGDHKNVHIMVLDMKNHNRLGELIGKVDCFIMLAWNGTRSASRMDQAVQKLNYIYSYNAAKSMISAGCTTLITAGSQAEYGPHKTYITESSECWPNTEYGIYKLKLYCTLESLCKKEGIRLIEPRFFSLYGPDDEKNTLVMKMTYRMLKNIPCELTECIQMWDFLYIQDAVEAIFKLLENNSINGVFNFGSGDCRPLKNFIEEMKSILESKSEIRYGVIPYPKTGMVSIQPDVSKLKRAINWQPKITFSEGIKKIVNTIA